MNVATVKKGPGVAWLTAMASTSWALLSQWRLMFLPAFVYVAITARFLPQIRKSPLAGPFLDGVNAAAVALMALVGWQFARASLTNAPAILIGVVSVILIFRYKVNSAWMVIGGALAGIVFQLLRWT